MTYDYSVDSDQHTQVHSDTKLLKILLKQIFEYSYMHQCNNIDNVGLVFTLNHG